MPPRTPKLFSRFLYLLGTLFPSLYLPGNLNAGLLQTAPELQQKRPEISSFVHILSRQERPFTLLVDFNGRINFSHESPGLFEHSEFILNKRTVTDLRLNESDIAQIKAILKVEGETREPGDSATPLPPVDFAKRQELWAKQAEQIEAVLSEWQINRLQQIQIQYLLQLNGIANCLENEDVVKVLQLPALGTKDAKAIRQLQETIANRLLQEEKDLLVDAWNELSEPLTENQQKLFEPEWKRPMVAPYSLGHVIRCLDSESFSKDLDLALESDELFSVWNTPIIQIGVDGNSIALAQQRTAQQLPEVSKYYTLGNLLDSGHVQKLVGIVPEQIEEIRSLSTDFSELKSKLAAELAVEMGIGSKTMTTEGALGEPVPTVVYEWPNDPVIGQQFSTKLNDRLADHAKQFRDLTEQVLVIHQREALRVLARQIKIRKFGPIADLMKGELKSYLGLDDQQTDKLVERAAEIRETLMQKSVQLKRDALEELISSLPSETRRRLKQLIGEPIESEFCDLGILGYRLLSHDVPGEF